MDNGNKEACEDQDRRNKSQGRCGKEANIREKIREVRLRWLGR